MNSKINSFQDLRKTAGAYRAARVIQTAGKLRMFDHTLSPASAQEIAASMNISIRGARIMLDALTALGLLKRDQGLYLNTALATEHLVTGSDSMMLGSLDHSERIYRRWATLPEVVRSGTPKQDDSDVMNDAAANRIFINAMHAHGYLRGTKIAKALDLKNVEKVIDVGGGAGSYLIAMIEKKPDIRGILVDHALTLNSAKEIIKNYSASQNITLQEMDLFEGDAAFGSDADLVMLSNILHIEGPEKNLNLLKRIRQSLKQSGRLIIQDFISDSKKGEPLDYALFAVNMLSGTDRGSAWRDVDVAAWLKQAGFGQIQALDTDTDSDVWEVFPA